MESTTKFFKNEPPEVLVLPPNILEKLGINLGNIQSCNNGVETKLADAPTEETSTSNIDADVLSNIHNNVCDEESSILETASLMRASVFLSPTFTNLKSNNVINDLQHKNFETATFECNVSTEVNTKTVEIFDKPEKNDIIEEITRNKNCKNVLPNLGNKINITSEEIIGSDKIKELIAFQILDNCNLVSVPINTIITKNTSNLMSGKLSLKPFKENSEIHCIDDNNENSVNILSSNGIATEFNKNTTLKLQNRSHKANILKSNKDDDVPKILKEVTENEVDEAINVNNNYDNTALETHIVSKFNENVCKGNINTRNELNEKSSENIEIKYSNTAYQADENCVNDENKDIYDVKVDKDNVTVSGNECNRDTIDIANTLIIPSKENSEHCNDNLNSVIQLDDVTPVKVSTFDNTNLDSEQEVAMKNDLNHIEICNNNKVINVNKNKVKTKLCIQGVEKPGGESESEHKGIYVKDLKTYSRGKRTKFSQAVFFENQDCLKNNLDIDVNLNCNINKCNSIKENKTQKFCICDDFGYFSYYDKDIDYQHIHYWEQKGAECSLDMLLSIYEENKLIETNVPEIDNNEINIVVEGENVSNHNVYNICWMNVDGILENTKDAIKFFAETKQPVEIIVHSQNNSTALLSPRKINKTDAQIENIELENVSSKSNKQHSQQSDKSKKKSRKRKIAEDEIETSITVSTTNDNADIIENKIINKNDKIANEVKLSENQFEKVPSKRVSLRKSDITKSVKSDTNISVTVNQVEKLVSDDLLNKSKINKIDNHRIKKDNQNIDDTIINNHSSETKKIITKTRKRSLASSEDNTTEVKKNKKEIKLKCGVCKSWVESSKWDNHVTNDHCFIAWEEGQQFDFQSEDLFMKLKQHLNDNGKLICAICDKIIKRVKKFLSHVEGCITYRNPFEMADDSISEVGADKSGSSRLRSKHVTCGVCKIEVNKNVWMKHISKEHNYLAWKEGEWKLDIDDETEVYEHLHNLFADVEKLECNSCGISCKCANSFLKHIKECVKTNEEADVSEDASEKVKVETSIKCGVCKNDVLSSEWQCHISKEHKYLAWKEGEPELDVDDSHRVYEYLYNLSKELGGLHCGKCGCRRKYVNAFLKHVESCDGVENPNQTMDSTMNESSISINKTFDNDNTIDNLDDIAKCGVCLKEVDKKDWEFHIKMNHCYKAWKEGQTPLNLDNEEEIYNHLYAMSKKYNGLTCNRCGMTRKYVKVYLQHIESCISQLPLDLNDASLQEDYKCGVCGEKVQAREWKSHAMINHYNIAWPEGQIPIDSKNPAAVEKCLKEYKQVYNKYVCNVCGISRVSAIGFFAHVVQCGKTEEEIDPHRDLCDICNNKYLIIYKNQHITMHRDQEYAKQRKLDLEVEKEEKKNQIPTKEILPERRLAAERARTVIEKYKKYKHNCTTCDFGGDSEEDVKNHTCRKSKYNFSDSEDSILLSSEQESDDTDVNSDLSNEEQEEIQKSAPTKKKKNGDPNPAAAFFPFSVQNPRSYLNESAEDFRKNHLTSNILYPQWRTCKFEAVPDELLSNYLPNVEESCKFLLHKGDWIAMKKFEGINDQKWASAAFVGGCIQCMSWTPAHPSDGHDALGHYVSIAAHGGPDAPRLNAEHLYAHHGLLQIWDYGNLREAPKFALGIAHDFGTVWAKDWCPSGARDMLSDSDTKSFKRLGLLAVACSNGSAYILSVPYPSTITEGEKKVYKLTPVAELRLTRGNRQRFQATAINWPARKGHSTIIVGYSDGTTALFDLDCDSPILTDTEDDMKIYYPFQDERTHNSCVTAVSSCPGAVGSSSATGGSRAGMRGVGRGGRATRSAVTATATCFMPHWPDLLLAGNDAIVYQAPNVVSWCGGGRRLGSQQAVCGCASCGRVALAAPPALRLVTAHPAHPHLHKITVALLQMKPLVNKKTKHKNDDLGTKLEPSTYEEVIKKYGVELKIIESFDKSYLQQSNKPRDHYPERFPLSDVSSMAFNTSPKQHKKLAVATHSGFIFVITV